MHFADIRWGDVLLDSKFMSYTPLGLLKVISLLKDKLSLLGYVLSSWTVARGLTMKSFQIHPSSSNFPCVTQTKILGPSKMKFHEFFRTRKLKLSLWTFFHPFFRLFLWNTLGNKSWIVSGFWSHSCVTPNKI